MYHVLVHSLAQRVLGHIRQEELLRAGDRVGVAVSGGIDSVALLRLLIELRYELGIVRSVVHFNHKLRGAESDADQEFVSNLAREHGLEFYSDSGDVAQLAAKDIRCGSCRPQTAVWIVASSVGCGRRQRGGTRLRNPSGAKARIIVRT